MIRRVPCRSHSRLPGQSVSSTNNARMVRLGNRNGFKKLKQISTKNVESCAAPPPPTTTTITTIPHYQLVGTPNAALLTDPRQLGHMPPATYHLLTFTYHLPPANSHFFFYARIFYSVRKKALRWAAILLVFY